MGVNYPHLSAHLRLTRRTYKRMYMEFPLYRFRPATGLEDHRRLWQVPAIGDDKPAGTLRGPHWQRWGLCHLRLVHINLCSFQAQKDAQP